MTRRWEAQFGAFQQAVSELFDGLNESDRKAYSKVLGELESKIR